MTGRGKADFKKATITKLREQVSNRCSKPNCRVICIAKGDDNKGNINSIGQAAHIHAAAPGGPRYDASMTDAERAHIDNGIWLCGNHATEIDRDTTKYTAETLREWKSLAIEQAKNELGKVLPSESDVVNILTTALSGVPTNISTQAVSYVASAVSDALKNLDPRLEVETSYIEGSVFHKISANENVEVKVTVEQEYSDLIRNLYETGRKISIPVSSVKLEGSPLLERIQEENLAGVFCIGPRQKPAILKCVLTNDKDFYVLDDIQGSLLIGSKIITFNGNSFDEMLTVEVVTEGILENPKLNISVNFSRWNNAELKSLRHIGPLKKIFEHITKGWVANIEIKTEQRKLLSGFLDNAIDLTEFREIYFLLDYYDSAYKIAKYFDIKEVVPETFDLTIANHSFLKEVVKIIERGEILIPIDRIKSTPEVVFTFEEHYRDVFKEQINTGKRQNVFMSSSENIEIFGKRILVTKKYFKLEHCYLYTTDNMDELRNGDVCTVAIGLDQQSNVYATYKKPDAIWTK